MLTGIHHTSITVSDMERSIAFYRDMLGFELIWDSRALGMVFEGPMADAVTGCPGTSQRLVFLEVCGQRLEFVEYTPTGKAQVGNKPSDTGSVHVCFLTDDIEELHARLAENEVVLHCAPQTIGETKVFYFRDPDGVVLEVMGGQPIV
jgi:glyoxylase I family protein